MSLFDRDRSAQRLPVSLITGFLGSGKTTLLNRLLQHGDMKDSLVLINEFGEVGLDHLFVEPVDGEMVLMQSGCLCCTVRGDLEKALRDAAAKRQKGLVPPFRRVLIETTGLADPAPVVQLLLANPMICHDWRLDAVVGTVDAVNGMGALDCHAEALKQAAMADRLLLTKLDLAAPTEAGALRARLRALNPAAPQFAVAHGEIDPALLFDVGPYDVGARAESVRDWLREEAYAEARDGGHSHEHAHGHRHGHDHDHARPDRDRHDAEIGSFCLTFDRPLDWLTISSWLATLRQSRGEDLLRVKGILNIDGESQPLVVHGVHHVFHPPVLLERWPDADRRSRLVVIARNFTRAEAEESWRAFQAEMAA